MSQDRHPRIVQPKPPFIDGVLSYARRTDEQCVKDCEHEIIEDFHIIREQMGIDAGLFNASRMFDALVENRAFVSANPTGLVVESSLDLERARREARYGVLFYCQKHYPLRGSIEPVAEWYANGLRTLQLAYGTIDQPNQKATEMLAGGSDQPEQGLTELGKRVISELNRLHMVVDVSHCSTPSVLQAVEHSTHPITANHSNARRLTPHRRNKTDTELVAIAEAGGVIGVTPISWMLDTDADGRADIDDFIAHVNYIVDLVGIDHVGLASDACVDGWEKTSRHYCDEQLAAPDRWKRVVQLLKKASGVHGGKKYSDEDISKLLGGNFLRIYQQVMVGLRPPQSAPVEIVAMETKSGLRLSWNPAEAVGCPIPKHDLILSQMTPAGLAEWKSIEDVKTTSYTVLAGDLEPGVEYYWHVKAYNELGFTKSAMQALPRTL